MPNSNPKVPKRKKSGISRIPRGKQKRSSYNYHVAHASLGLPADASFTQVLSQTLQTGPNPAIPRSPPKKVVKAKLAEELKDRDVTMRAVQAKTRQISTLKQQVRALSDALQSERKKLRATVAKLLDDAEGVMAKAFGIQAEADQKMSAAEQKLLQQQQKMRCALALSSEREFYSREMGMCKHFIACSFMLYQCLHTLLPAYIFSFQ